MKPRTRLISTTAIVALAALALTPVSGLAADDDGHGHTQHGAHEHGVSVLNVAIEDDGVEMNLIAPGADIVGFEHAAEDDADKAALAAAVEKLEAGGKIFMFPDGAGCELEEAEIKSGLLEDDHDHDHGHDDHKDEHAHDADHKDEHAHDDDHKDDDHKDEHAHDDHGHKDEHAHGEGKLEEGHAEFRVHYHFHCDSPDSVTAMETSFFSTFTNARELVVQIVGPDGQAAVELTPESTSLEF